MSRRNLSNNRKTGKAVRKNTSVQRKTPKYRKKVQVPMSQGSQIVFREPRQEITAGQMRIRHREPLGPLNGGSLFFMSEYALNPGERVTFPWLSSIASGYEMYKFNSMNFQFLTTASSTFTGELIMAPNYNASGNTPINALTLEQLQGFARTLVWKDLQCNLNAANLNSVNPKRYVRSGSVPVGSDVKLYDAGKFYVASQGQATNSQIGSLFVEYDVTLYTPKPNALILQNGAFENFTTGPWDALNPAWFGPNPVANASEYGNIDFTVDNIAQECIIRGLESGATYIFNLQIGISLVSGPIDIVFSTEMHAVELSVANGTNDFNASFLLRPSASAGTFDISGNPTGSGYTGTVIYVCELPEGAGGAIV